MGGGDGGGEGMAAKPLLPSVTAREEEQASRMGSRFRMGRPVSPSILDSSPEIPPVFSRKLSKYKFLMELKI